MPRNADPITILERLFDRELTHHSLAFYNSVSEDQWIDFAKTYRAEMQSTFCESFLRNEDAGSVRLYFEPRLAQSWDEAVENQYSKTPLLGLNPHPDDVVLTSQQISRLLNPLKKHLLMASSLYIRDSFYYCFDGMADATTRNLWEKDPDVRNRVLRSVRSIKNWLPILIELRPFIESRALVFTPYYLTPSFPDGATSPKLKDTLKQIGLQADPNVKFRNGVRVIENRDFSEDDVMAAWLNARIWHLDPVFPNRATFDWASRLYFPPLPSAQDKLSDWVSFSLLPFDDVPLDELVKMRQNEEVFAEIRKNFAGCKKHLESMCTLETDRRLVTAACKDFLTTNLSKYEGRSLFRKMKVIDDNPASVGPLAWGCAIGLATILVVNPVAGVAVSAVPALSSYAQAKIDPKRRAIAHLTALL